MACGAHAAAAVSITAASQAVELIARALEFLPCPLETCPGASIRRCAAALAALRQLRLIEKMASRPACIYCSESGSVSVKVVHEQLGIFEVHEFQHRVSNFALSADANV